MERRAPKPSACAPVLYRPAGSSGRPPPRLLSIRRPPWLGTRGFLGVLWLVFPTLQRSVGGPGCFELRRACRRPGLMEGKPASPPYCLLSLPRDSPHSTSRRPSIHTPAASPVLHQPNLCPEHGPSDFLPFAPTIAFIPPAPGTAETSPSLSPPARAPEARRAATATARDDPCLGEMKNEMTNTGLSKGRKEAFP